MKPQPRLERAKERQRKSRADFEKAHDEGDAALDSRDHDALIAAVDAETAAVSQHIDATRELGEIIRGTVSRK
jgi:hypothetical protein